MSTVVSLNKLCISDMDSNLYVGCLDVFSFTLSYLTCTCTHSFSNESWLPGGGSRGSSRMKLLFPLVLWQMLARSHRPHDLSRKGEALVLVGTRGPNYGNEAENTAHCATVFGRMWVAGLHSLLRVHSDRSFQRKRARTCFPWIRKGDS